ncbi:MAG: hypothetical protein ABSC19_07595 [Syntrophorhabdales bacterium]|jgi:dolichol kinase
MKRPSRARSLFHLSGSIIPLIYLATDRRTALFVALSALVLAALIDTLRITGYISAPFLEALLKEKEMKGPSGTVFYLISCVVAILLFDKDIASASIFVLAICDPLSSIVGSKWGRIPLFGKSVEGTGVFLVSSLIVLACFRFGPSAFIPAAAAAAAAELFSSRFVDDNLTIPLVTALALTLLTR